jgi:hypothetical protein
MIKGMPEPQYQPSIKSTVILVFILVYQIKVTHDPPPGLWAQGESEKKDVYKRTKVYPLGFIRELKYINLLLSLLTK